jgi:hypothetical protein
MNKLSLKTLYVECAQEATRGLKRNWPILLGSVGLALLIVAIRGVFGSLGVAGGMLVGMAQVAVLSLHYSWLQSTVEKEKLSFRALLDFDYSMFFTVISVAFIFFLIQFVASSLLQGLDKTILLFLGLGLIVIFNAIPEVIIVERIESVPALGQAAEFTREHALAWFLPLVALLLPAAVQSYELVLVTLASTDPLSPALIVPLPIAALLGALGIHASALILVLTVVLANWYMLFRIHLFKRLARA